MEGKRYLSEASIALMTQAHTTPYRRLLRAGLDDWPQRRLFPRWCIPDAAAILPHEGLVEIFLVQQAGAWPNGGKNLTNLFSETAESAFGKTTAAANSTPVADVRQTPTATTRPVRPTPPTRDPTSPGYVTAKDLPDGAVPPADADGNFIIGPTHPPHTGDDRSRRCAAGHRLQSHNEVGR